MELYSFFNNRTMEELDPSFLVYVINFYNMSLF